MAEKEKDRGKEVTVSTARWPLDFVSEFRCTACVSRSLLRLRRKQLETTTLI